ncbi:MAG: hypothetical protein HZB55_09400 [Deltaproteobacteria bacterium]|nr:hypothetical protein [Deltaproteobacteria bacterium]
MGLDAKALFDFCVRLRGSGGTLVIPSAIEVTGVVKRATLGYDHVPLVSLSADSVGMCLVECRCLSWDVLLRARPGSPVTVTGFCRGLEDGVTAVLDRCELVEVRGERVFTRRAQARKGQRHGQAGVRRPVVRRPVSGPGLLSSGSRPGWLGHAVRRLVCLLPHPGRLRQIAAP